MSSTIKPELQLVHEICQMDKSPSGLLSILKFPAGKYFQCQTFKKVYLTRVSSYTPARYTTCLCTVCRTDVAVTGAEIDNVKPLYTGYIVTDIYTSKTGFYLKTVVPWIQPVTVQIGGHNILFSYLSYTLKVKGENVHRETHSCGFMEAWRDGDALKLEQKT